MQKRILLLVALAGCLEGSLIAGDTARQETPDTIAWLRFVASELRQLRLEVLNDRIERQEARVRVLDHELQQVRNERQDGEEVQRLQEQEISQLVQRLSDPALSPDERSQLQSLRSELTVREPTERAGSAQKEAQTGERLRQEQLRLESLRSLARSLAPQSAQSQQ